MSDGSIAVIYRWRIAADAEAAFRDRWSKATLDLRALGGLGSMLSRNAAGEWVAIALWRNPEARRQAFDGRPSPPPIAGVEFLGEEVLHVADDLWLASAFQAGTIAALGKDAETS